MMILRVDIASVSCVLFLMRAKEKEGRSSNVYRTERGEDRHI